MISKTISYLFCTRKKLKLLISLEVEAMLLKQVKLRLSRPYTNRILQLETHRSCKNTSNGKIETGDP
jgi:hypothetical protein